MTLTQVTEIEIKNRIQEFHDYLKDGLSLDAAKKIILDSTCLKPVIKYVIEYQA